MCGIFGVGFLKGHTFKDPEKVKNYTKVLFQETQIRGRTACGIALVSTNKVIVVKRDCFVREMLKSDDYNNAVDSFLELLKGEKEERPLAIIGHCRQQTKGDARNNHNNHPVVADNIIGVHNGVISNDDELFDFYKVHASHASGFRRRAQVDSEIIFRLIDYFVNKQARMTTVEAIRQTHKIIDGSHACAFVNARSPEKLWLFKHSNPSEAIFYKDPGIITFASAASFIRRASWKMGFNGDTSIKYKEDYGLGIHLEDNQIQRFKLKKYKTIKEIKAENAGEQQHLPEIYRA